MGETFHGAKAVVLIGEQVLLYRRDPHVRWGGLWDMPGGGREGVETPQDCLAREVFEEFGLDLSESEELWAADFPAMAAEGEKAWFFVVQFPPSAVSQIKFGEEGQYWRVFPLEAAVTLPDLIEPLRKRLIFWLRQVSNTNA